MKRISLILLSLFILVACFSACNKDDDSQVAYANRTQAFYANMDPNSFWYDAKIVTPTGMTYTYSQATDGLTVTTIVDRDGTANDIYEIFYNGSDMKYIHKLNLSSKKYDTVITKDGHTFLFGDYNYTMFVNLVQAGEEKLGDKTYYCEYFKSTATAGGTATGYDKYYFQGDTLCAVVTPQMEIYFNEYSNTIPEHVYLEVPAGYKAGQLIDNTVLDFSEVFGDISLDLD